MLLKPARAAHSLLIFATCRFDGQVRGPDGTPEMDIKNPRRQEKE